jgi:hypothetical protein
VRIDGRSQAFTRGSDSGRCMTFHFCPECGSTVHYQLRDLPDVIGVAVGMFADRGFPPPRISVYTTRQHPWVELRGIEQSD